MFRASVGIGLGLGGSAKIGPVDVGCLGGVDLSLGNYYGAKGVHLSGDFGIPALARGELVYVDKDDGRVGLSSLVALPFYPAIRASKVKEVQEALPYLYTRPTEVAVSAYAGFFAVHLGFDVGVPVRGFFHSARLAAGGVD